MIHSLFSGLTLFIITSISSMGYAGVALLMAIESACVPLPSEIIMPFSGYLVAAGRFTLLGVTLAGAFGSVMGSVLFYWIGFHAGRGVVERYGRYLLITRHDLDRADRFFARHGDGAIFFSRMMPIVRTFISLPAGIAKMDFKRFVLYTFLGSVPWCLGLGFVGEKLGENWETIGGYFHKFDTVLAIIILVGMIWYIRKHLILIKNEKYG